jgi:hypothetical protein
MPREEEAPLEPDPAPSPSSSSSPSLPDLLLRPLADNHELRHIFREDLGNRLQLYSGSSLQKGEDTPADAAAWLATRPPVTSRRRWLWPLLALAVLMLAAALLLEAYEYLPGYAFTATGAPPLLQDAARRQILSAPPGRTGDALLEDGWDPVPYAEANWHAHPDNAASFYDYATSFKDYRGPDPPGYEATWKRLDPGNAFWPLLKAGNSVWGNVRTGTPTKDEIIALLHTAASLPDFHPYDAEKQSYLLGLVRTPQTSGQVDAFRSVFQRHHSDTFQTWQRLLSRLHDWQADLSTGPHGAGDYLKLTAEVEQLTHEASRLRPLENHPALRRAKQVLQVRLYILAAAGCFLLLAFALTLRHLPARSPAARLALCLRQLLHPRDAWPAMGTGIALAAVMLALGAAFSRPWDSYQTSADAFLLPMAHLVAPILVLMVASVRLQVSPRIAFLGLGSPRWQARVAMMMTVLALTPLLSGSIALIAATLSGSPEVGSHTVKGLTIVARTCYGVVVLWLAGSLFLGYAFPSANVRHRLIAARLIPPVLIASMVMSALALALHGVERHLVKEAVSLVGAPWGE